MSEKKELKIEKYLEMVEKGDFSTDFSLQRNADQWTEQQQSLLIDSVLKGYIIPDISVVEYEEKKVVVDGLQRTTALKKFYNNQLKLTGVDEKFEGKTYAELTSNQKSIFGDASICVADGGKVDAQGLQESFIRLNNGVALNKVQVNRAFMGVNGASWSETQCKKKLLNELAKYTPRQIKDDAPLECLQQGVMLIDGCLGNAQGNFYPWKNITRDTVKEYVSSDFSKKNSEDLEIYEEALKLYENLDFKGQFSKSMLPVLIVLARYAVLSGVSAEELCSFFERKLRDNELESTKYAQFKGAGNTSKAKTIGRIKVFIEEFNNAFPNAQKPEINLDTSRKSSKKKEVSKEVKSFDEQWESVSDMNEDEWGESSSTTSDIVTEVSEATTDNVESASIEADSVSNEDTSVVTEEVA